MVAVDPTFTGADDVLDVAAVVVVAEVEVEEG